MVFCQDVVRRSSFQSFFDGPYHRDGAPGGVAPSVCGAESVYSCPGDVAESVYSQTDEGVYTIQQKNFVYFCNYALSPEKYMHKFQDRIYPIQKAILPCFKLSQW